MRSVVFPLRPNASSGRYNQAGVPELFNQVVFEEEGFISAIRIRNLPNSFQKPSPAAVLI
jgi:hypothetical protein